MKQGVHLETGMDDNLGDHCSVCLYFLIPTSLANLGPVS